VSRPNAGAGFCSFSGPYTSFVIIFIYLMILYFHRRPHVKILSEPSPMPYRPQNYVT
jgi:hypothetical protein